MSTGNIAADPVVLERLLRGPTCLFDGVCNLCNGSVRFILATEADHEMQFAAVQSVAGRAVLPPSACRT